MTGRLRRARPTDRPALLALQALLDSPDPSLFESGADRAGLCLVSTTAGDRPVGYLRALPGADCAWIVELVVAPRARREGRATALIERCCYRLEDDHDRVRLAVRPGNEPAIACYRSLDFERVDTRADLYDDDPAVVFERSLDEH